LWLTLRISAWRWLRNESPTIPAFTFRRRQRPEFPRLATTHHGTITATGGVQAFESGIFSTRSRLSTLIFREK